jgi:hypothetical protein
MTQQAELMRKIDKLPPQYIGEVIDFVGYLQQKAKNDASADIPTDTERRQEAGEWRNPLFGLAREKGASLTFDRFMATQEEEIARENENDRRLWNDK